jgi:hypothetical protein
MKTKALPAGLGVRQRVAIVDDQLDVRQLLALRLDMVGALEVVGQAANTRLVDQLPAS